MSPTGPTARTPTDAWVRLPPTELLAAVQLQPTPNIPPASIRELLRPVYDDNGQLVDWVLVASGFEQHDAVSAYWRWRNTWRQHWPLGPISNVASLTEVIADIEHDLDRGLDRLLATVVAAAGRPVTVSVDEAPALITELVTVRLVLSADDRTGRGIVDDMPAVSRGAGLARTWVTPSRPDAVEVSADSDASEVGVEVMLTGTPTSAVVLRPDAGASGLVVLHGGPPHAAFVGVTAVDLRGETAVVLNERGMSLRLDLHEARPLSWLVPRSLRWHVRAVPIVTVWALLFEGLGAALSNAIASGEPLVISGDAGIG